MRYWRHGLLQASATALLGAGTLLTGHPLVGTGAARGGEPPALREIKEPAHPMLAPRMALLWSIQWSEGQATSVMSGDAAVGPDGKIELGPYGSVYVAGLTLEQACTAAERHLAAYLKEPHVGLQPATGAGNEPSGAPIVRVGRVVPLADDEKEPTPPQQTPPAVSKSDADGPVIGAAELPQPQPLVARPSTPGATEPIGPPKAGNRGQTAPTRSATPQRTGGPSSWRPIPRDGPGTMMASASRSVAQASGVGGPTIATMQPEPGPASDLNIQPRPVSPEAIGVPLGLGVPGAIAGDPHLMHPHGPPPVPNEQAMVPLPPYIIDPPDILLVESAIALPEQPIRGQHLVRPDGTISLGIYGSVYVKGMTLDMAKDVIAAELARSIRVPANVPDDSKKVLQQLQNNPEQIKKVLNVDVLSYNSKYYYVITDGGGYGEQVIRLPITGHETVLDGISQIGGLGAVASREHIWLARANVDHHGQQVLSVDWIGITQHGDWHTNYQVMPNDRIYVRAKCLITADTALARLLSPVERIFGIVLLGSTTVNSIKNSNGGNTGR